ncbi:MAG: hypothetical protein Q9172_005747 [Xanthocarpia lactea]
MALSDSAFIDDLLADRTVEDNGVWKLVKIPGFVDLSAAQQAAVCVRLDEIEQPKNAHSLDADALCARLNSISSLRIPDKSFSELSSSSTSTTPPPDYEAIKEEYRSLEQEARENLKADGCPPCLPDDPSFLVHDAPVQYKGIISYWKAFPANHGGVLCAQWKDRKSFRDYQERNRKHYLQVKTLDRLEDRIHERRRKHRLEGAVHLHPDPRQQGQDDTWKEFQDFHLQKLEELEKELQIERENLKATRTKLETGDISEFGTILSSPEDIAASRVQSYEVRSASADRLRKLHQEILLPWIEEQCTMVTTAQAASSGGAGAHNHQLDITCRKPIPCRKKRTAKERSFLKPNRSGISKSVLQKRVLRRQEKPREVQKGLANSAASDYSTTQMPEQPTYLFDKATYPFDKATEYYKQDTTHTSKICSTPTAAEGHVNEEWTEVKET